MSWLPIEKLTTEEKDIIQDFTKKKTTLHGKYHQQIKDLDTTHETWIGNFSNQHKKKLKICQELYKVDQHKIDKTEYSTDDLQAYAIYKLAVDTYKNTKEKVTEKYTKDLEVLNLDLDKIAKEINKGLQEREAVAEEAKREEQLLKHKEEIKGIVYDIKRVDKAIGKEDKLFLNRPEVLALDKALARRYQHKLSRHKRALENRLQRRKEVVKGKGLSLEVALDEELSDGGYSSIEELKEKETLPHRHRIKRNRFREPYPSLFEYPHQIPTHHTVVNLDSTEQQELKDRKEAKAKQEQEKKAKAKKKGKKEVEQPEIVEVENSEQSEDIQIPPTITMANRNGRGNRNGRNGDDGDDDRQDERNHYWSLRDIPKFEGKGEQPYSHLMEFEDYLVASGVTLDEDDNDPRMRPDYRDIINKFKASLKKNARVWYSMYIEKRIPELQSAEGWKTVKSKFLTYFNPIGSTKEQQIKAWKELKWKPKEEKLTDFVFRFSQLAHELGYSDEQQVSHFVLCIPRGMYLYLEGARTIPDAVENLRKGIALGGMETFGAISKPVQDDSKPTVPFMVMKENRTQSSTEEALRVVKESIHDSMYESSKTLVKQLDKIGDKLTNVVEDFQKKQNSRNSRGRNRDRSNSRSRDNSRDNYRNGGRDYYRNRSRDSRDNSRDRGRGRDRSTSRERRRNQPRSGSGQRYFDKSEICSFCNRSGHLAHNCFRLEGYLKRKGKKIVLDDDDDDVEEISQAVQHLNTKLNSLKVSKSTNN